MNNLKLAGVLFALTLVIAPSRAAEPAGAKPQVLGPSGADPTVALDTKTGTRYVAWTRPGKSSPEVVLARSDGGRYADPVVVSAGDTDIVSATVNPAQVAVGSKGELYVLYERRVASQYFEGGRGIPRLARSTDGGKSFAAPVDVAATDGVETGAEATSLAVGPNGAVLVAWLDYRDVFARAKLPEDQRPEDLDYTDSDDPKVQVRLSRSTDGGLSFGPSVLIAESASERSRVALAFGPDGTLYSAWRAKLNQFKGSYDSVRDVLVASSSDGGATWSAPVKVHDDRFKAGDCPEITVGLGADSKGRLHVAWYTGTSVRPGVYYAVSEDGGKSFSKPLTLLTDAWVPYANVKLTVDGSDHAWVAFEDRRDDSRERVVLTQIDPQATPAQPQSWPGRAPDIAAQASAVTLVWSGDKGAILTKRLEARGLRQQAIGKSAAPEAYGLEPTLLPVASSLLCSHVRGALPNRAFWPMADHRTDVGATRAMALPDGTRLWLNTASAFNVEFTADLRRLRLLAGEILIETAPDPARPARPFVVDSAQGRVRALGTRFSVRQMESENRVAVFAGAIEIQPAIPKVAAGILNAGQETRFTRQTIAAPQAVRAERSAWTRGVLLADNLPLSEFVAKLARYRRGFITYAPEIANLRLVGAFPLADTDRALRALESTLPVRVSAPTPWWVSIEPR